MEPSGTFQHLRIGDYYVLPRDHRGFIPYQKRSYRFARTLIGDTFMFEVSGCLQVQRISLLEYLAIVAAGIDSTQA